MSTSEWYTVTGSHTLPQAGYPIGMSGKEQKGIYLVFHRDGRAPANPTPGKHVAFIHSLLQIIEHNLNNPEFSVCDLCRKMLLSQPQLYRKVFEQTGKSPSRLIRTVRMCWALELLATTELNISEIAWKVGFNDPNYFARVFHQEFGQAPSVWRR